MIPQFKTEADISELRLDDDWMADEMNRERLNAYMEQIGSPALRRRVTTLLKAYGL